MPDPPDKRKGAKQLFRAQFEGRTHQRTGDVRSVEQTIPMNEQSEIHGLMSIK